ncbi:MAG: Grx4 family monothiol glutaredoxin [Deltaproteobacteria bacterium]|nr:Grx4 family monothiol glutaredoxin [Deltaproteobacteria bacterium]
MAASAVIDRIEQAIKNNRIMLYMKGEKTEPMCGFSAQVVHILNSYGLDYHTENVLEDWDLREAIKEYSSWPTIPQLYVDGQFIGGCDIVMELHRKGELPRLLNLAETIQN